MNTRALLSRYPSLLSIGVALWVTLSNIAPAHAVAYAESGDAGDMTATAQVVYGAANTALTSITGNIGIVNGISEGDMFQIYISAPSAFSATTTAFSPGRNNFDTQLFLFTLGGMGIVANDDDPDTGSAQSTIPAGAFGLMAGFYDLLITGSGRYPGSPGGLIFPNFTDGSTDPTGVYGPSGAGGGAPLSRYVGNSNEGGSYAIALTGAQFVTRAAAVPEPSTIAIVASGLVLLGLARRRRIAPKSPASSRRRLVRLAAAGSVLAAIGSFAPAIARAAPNPASADADVPENLTLGLREMVQSYQSAAARTSGLGSPLSGRAIDDLLAEYPLARADDKGRVIVDIYLDGSATIDAVVARLEGLGCRIEARVDWYDHGALAVWLPLDQASKVGRMTGVHVVKLALKPRHHVGKVTSQGTFVLKTEALTGRPGGLGQGITVGALSDSYNMLKTTGTGTANAPLFANVKAANDVASGDLPGTGNPNGYATPVNVLKDYTSSAGVEDEGRAMLQIIHDMAPAAALAFYTADISEVDFAAGIVALQQAGANVICDDVGYFDEPMFSDGILSQAIDRVSALGVVYFSSAGNDDSSGYAATFSPVANSATSQGYLAAQGVTYGGLTALEQAAITDFHAFGTNPDGTPILVQNIRIPGTSADATGKLEFQWDDPYLMQGGGNNVTTDFDILVFNAAGAIQTSRSGMTNNYNSKVPQELPNTSLSPATSYKIVIARTNRAAASTTPNLATHIRYNVQTNDTPVRGDFITISSAESHGHPTAATAVGTAAYRYDASPVVDVHDSTHAPYPIVEQFSSNGPASIYFDAAGNRLSSPIVRKQPLLAAVNGVSTSFFPPASVTSGTTPPAPPGPSNPSPYDFNGDGYPNFFGTSAAAPSGAGVAAIVLGVAKANNIAITSSDVRTLLTSTTQANEDQTPNYAVGTAGPATIVASGYARSDNNAYTVSYNGSAGTTLSQITIDLSTIGIHFDATTAIPTDTSTTATATGVVVSAFNGTTTPSQAAAPSVTSFSVGAGSTGTANSLLTVNFANFNPGATLKFGIGRRNDGTNIFAQLSEVLGGQTPGSPGALVGARTSTGAAASGRFVNAFGKKWNYKVGYGLIDANAAVTRLLAQ